MSASNFLEDAVLNHFFRNGSIQSPPQLYLALYISDPTDDDLGTEIAGGGYQRQMVSFSSPIQINGKATISNNIEIRYPVATANWGTITHFGIRTALEGGNLLAYAPVPVPKLIESGDEAKFNVSTLTVSMD